MNTSILKALFSGTVLLSLPCAAIAADMDTPIFEQPVRYDPSQGEVLEEVGGNLAGFGEASYAFGTGTSGGISADGSRWALRGAFNVQVDRNWNVQLDGLYNNTSVGPVTVDTLGGAGHTYYKVPDAYALGAFVQVNRFGSNVLTALAPLGADPYALDVVAGAEAAVFTGPASFHGQIGFGRASYMGVGGDHILAKAGAKIYATDNIRFDADGMWNRLNILGAKIELFTLSATGNYRLSQIPATLFAGYQYDAVKAGAGGVTIPVADTHSFKTGLRFHFGSNSLRDEERRGPVWSTSAVSF
jgi:hypothetical protein